MPQSLTKIFTHLTFSTKYREEILEPELEVELYPYLAKIFRECESPSLAINGTKDHIHALFLLSKNIALCKVIEEVKKSSSKWIKTKGERYKGFYWQNGYGAFSVSRSHVEVVKNYIANQKKHHTKKTFKEEYLELLNKYQIEYDERYLWD